MSQSIKSKAFNGVRVEIETSLSFNEVIARLKALTGHTSIPDVVSLASKVKDWAEYEREVQARFVGKSGFMLFAEIDHGAWIGLAGIQWKSVRWILGNPLFAITMIRHDLDAALFVPVELLVNETAGGAKLVYVRPSSLIAYDDTNPELSAAAQALDVKFDALCAEVTAAGADSA